MILLQMLMLTTESIGTVRNDLLSKSSDENTRPTVRITIVGTPVAFTFETSSVSWEMSNPTSEN